MINVRIKVGDLRDDLRADVTEWIRSSLNLDPSDLGEWMLVRYKPDPGGSLRGGHVLHLSKRRRGPDGHGVVLDQAEGRPVSEPLLIELTDEQWKAMPAIGFEVVH